MNKKELVEAVAAETGLTKHQARKAVDAVFESIEDALKRGDRVSLIGFGTFTVQKRAARMGRNPRTGVTMKIPATKRPVLSAGKKLSKAISGGTDDPGPSITAKGKRRK
ncbi:histone family protein DNA-binding protein [Alcanivorax sp. 521-1]|uniref:Histone family protein DNA-binding protein n=1 Tax=Alloalcanivorax profundimaris TaxID=2735259 RepID=A0ABS0AWD9_9GAMM|nr:HU family DNA-binding protein [Alloalcanivorax profundimaris]MBF5058458.1 histone family protein DNA-binding protein [Alloalcanivorax profundimaris]MBM1145110.1 HU family DNA-binding protein [Alcanivorax sp. ZXX171]